MKKTATKTTTKATPRSRSSRSGPGPKRRAKIAKDAGPPKAAPPVSGKGIRHLRALGHHLDPVVHVGKEGVTDALVDATRAALLAHELIKVRIGTEAPADRKDIAADLALRAGCTLAQILGRTALLYKRHPNKPRLVLPR